MEREREREREGMCVELLSLGVEDIMTAFDKNASRHPHVNTDLHAPEGLTYLMFFWRGIEKKGCQHFQHVQQTTTK